MGDRKWIGDELVAEPGSEDCRTLSSFLDLTTLEGTDNDFSVEKLCWKALSLAEKGLHSPAAVCVYSPFVRRSKQLLSGSGIMVATVCGLFPSGQGPLSLKVDEVKFALDEGADELDMVISRGKMISGEESFVFEEIAMIKELSKDVHLKVILETGELQNPILIKRASEIAIAAGADFIKTSTGKVKPAATEEAAEIMLNVIRDHFDETGKRIGFKPAGGISEPLQAWRYYQMVKVITGNEWLNNKYFRIGASRLADNLQNELLTQ